MSESNAGYKALLKKFGDCPKQAAIGTRAYSQVALSVAKCFGGVLEKALDAPDNPPDAESLGILDAALTDAQETVDAVLEVTFCPMRNDLCPMRSEFCLMRSDFCLMISDFV
jgi:hypothetical protein